MYNSQTALNLAKKVKEMRDLQREYFRTRESATLKQCKAVERAVDKLIEKFYSEWSEPGEGDDPKELKSAFTQDELFK